MHADMVLLLVLGAVAATAIPAGLVLYPLWKRWARRLEQGDRSPDLQLEVDELRARVNELEERLDYSERVLTQGRVPGQLER
ncbi:MAG TPA: hypothetical protein VGP80_04070 [Gemmatimonadales bacterium]|jgi:hypothetical protein|nr:hypothetical protein [Gemmatimonadales bacterium]